MAEIRFSDAKRLSHAYIVSAQAQDESLRTAYGIAAAAVCVGEGSKPCGVCRACRKAESGIHPDIITIRRLTDDKGKVKKEIGVDQIRQMSSDAWVLPNEADRKVYVIDEADKMNIPAQNAALKLLEEPPGGAMFLLCVTNASLLLPTVRSRCAEMNRNGEKGVGDEESAKLAKGYIAAVATGDRAELFRWCAKNEGLDTRATAAFVDSVCELLADMLCNRAPDLSISKGALMKLNSLLVRCRTYLKVNVGVKHIFALLAVDSIPEGGNRG